MNSAHPLADRVAAALETYDIPTGGHVWCNSTHAALFLPSIDRYIVFGLDGSETFTNDLPHWFPELLTPAALLLRAERFAPCRGPGHCAPWCTVTKKPRRARWSIGDPTEPDDDQ